MGDVMLWVFIFNMIALCSVLFEKEGIDRWRMFVRKHHEKKYLENELVEYFQFLLTFVSAGVLLPQAMAETMNQRRWIFPLSHMTKMILGYFKNGSSFPVSCEKALNQYQQNNKVYSRYTRELFVFIHCLGKLWEGGGNMTLYITNHSNDLQNKIAMNKKFQAQIAQILCQAYVILAAPLVLGGILFVIKPQNILFFFQSPQGLSLFFLMVFLMGCGAFTIFRMVKQAL